MTEEEQSPAGSARTAMSGCLGLIFAGLVIAALAVGISNTPSPLHGLYIEVCATAAAEGNPCP